MRGFTLIEILVVTAISMFMAGSLLTHLSRTRVGLSHAVLLITQTIREAQADALAGILVQGTTPCGYGVHFQSGALLLYAGPVAGNVCATDNHQYQSGTSRIIRTVPLADASLEIIVPAPDVFFEPPNPTTFLNNVNTPGTSATISVRRPGAVCPSADCRTLVVTTAGTVKLQ